LSNKVTVYVRKKLPRLIQQIRVAAYCRVSTKNEEQVYSLKNQTEYYEKKLNSSPNWVPVGIYADSASGRKQNRMLQFCHMMEACRRGEIDMIIIKSVSRFGRNTLEVLLAFDELRKLGVDIFFEVENLSLSDPQTMLILKLYACYAQDESERKSRDIIWGIRHSFQTGKSKIRNRPCYGYKKTIEDELVVEPGEAEFVRQIFEWRAEGASLRAISGRLKERGIKSPRGGEVWGTETLSKLLANEKYTGNVLLQKTYVQDYFSGRQAKNDGQLDRYLIQNTHPAIISEELFTTVQNSDGYIIF